MSKVKKLTDYEFVELMINKELEIADADVSFKDIASMTKEEQDKFRFWTRYSFKTPEEFLEWRKFYFEHAYEYFPKRTSIKELERNFQYFNLMWGLKYDFPIEQINNYNK